MNDAALLQVTSILCNERRIAHVARGRQGHAETCVPGQTRIHRTNPQQHASSITERVLGATATAASISSSHGVKVLFVATTRKVADETKHHDPKNDGNAREHDGSDGNILVAFLLIGLQSC
mmetsp:Transcript_4162/g.26348  ORF Transcript_4162/g.26348 Transcript_4162/m.26348 type:complete len:121 (+) Transcript_4162:2064-2426(+)